MSSNISYTSRDGRRYRPIHDIEIKQDADYDDLILLSVWIEGTGGQYRFYGSPEQFEEFADEIQRVLRRL